MTFLGRHRTARTAALAAAAGAALALAAGAQAGTSAQAAPQLAADSICKLTASSEWRKIDDAVSKASNDVSQAMAGAGGVKAGQKGARTIADALRKESKLIGKTSGGSDKARKALAAAYTKAGDMYDAVAKVLPDLAAGMKAAQKGDTKALQRTMEATAKIMQPASQAMASLQTSMTELFKTC